MYHRLFKKISHSIESWCPTNFILLKCGSGFHKAETFVAAEYVTLRNLVTK
jgi:hypothetical protein